MLVNESLLKLYADNNQNVLFSGYHGIGKTEIIRKIFNEKYGDKWAYFSSSTMDAYIDFIGAPKSVQNDDGVWVLKLVKPERFAYDNIEALFFDEFNRAPKKVRNAVMELMQFKSINGKKFKNLKVIWGAINPENDEINEYDVEKIDPAQYDRFQVRINLPYILNTTYLEEKYGLIARPFIEWWESLVIEQKYKISPRRLDVAINAYLFGGDLSHFLTIESNIGELKKRIQSCSIDDEWSSIKLMETSLKESFFKNISNIEKFEKFICCEISTYLDFIPEDYIVSKLTINKNINWAKSILRVNNKVSLTIKESVENIVKINFDEYLNNLINSTDNFGVLINNSSLDLKEKNVVLQGNFKLNYKRGNGASNIEDLLILLGAIVQDIVTRSTDFVICADINSDSFNIKQAKKLGKKIISEEEFHKYYGYE